MAVINVITGIYDNVGNDIFSEVSVPSEPVLEKNPNIYRGNDGANVVRIITPISPEYTRDITFLLNSGRTVEYKSFTTSGTIDVIYQGLEQTWNYYNYSMTADVLSDTALLKSSPLYYTARFREQDPLYYGEYDTSGELPLIATDPTLVEGNFATVGTTTFTTYEYDATLDQWDDLGFLKNQYVQTINTAQQLLTVFPTVQGSETSASPSEIDLIKNQINNIINDIEEIEDEHKQQDVDGNFEPTNDDAWSSDKRMETYLVGEYAQKDKDFVVTELDYNSGSADAGKVSWNETEQTTDRTINANVTIQDGRELLKLGRNTSGVKITNGSVIAIIGSVGNVAEIELVDVSDAEQSFKVIGVATEDILNNDVGNITLIGRVRDLDTSAWAEGTILYASATNGELTDVCPPAPNRCILMAVVETSNAGSGVIWCWPRPVPHLSELSDLEVTTPQVGDIVYYDGTKWVNQENSLINLTDVNIISPQAGEVLEYNGVEWVAGDIGTQGAGKSITFYIEDVNSSIAPYETLSEVPLGLAEEDDSATLNSGDGEVQVGGYITEELGRSKIEAGNWVFETFARISTQNKVGNFVIRVYKRSSGGTETELFNVTTEDITQTTNQLYSTLSTQSEFTIATTDRLLVKYFATTTSVSNVTLTLVHSGTENATHIDTPLQTLHNDLAGLQGGASNERYHLTQAELLELQGLSDPAGASGVGYDGSTGFTGKTNVQDAIDQAKTDIDSIVAGGVADNSITDAKMGTDVKIGSNSTYQTNTGSSATDVYGALEEIVIGDGIRAESTQTYTDIIHSTFGTINPIDFGSPLFPEFLGLTLNQDIVNGDSGLSYTAGGVGNRIMIDSTGQLVINNAYSTSYQNFDIISGNKYYLYVETSEATLDGRVGLVYSDATAQTIGSSASPTKIASEIITANKSLKANPFAVDNISAVTSSSALVRMVLIDITNTPYALLTASQINARLPEYIEGITDLTNFAVKGVGKNLLDTTELQISRSGYDNSDVLIADNVMTVKNVTENITMMIAEVQPSTQYFIKSSDNSLTTTGRIRVYEYDSLPTETLEGTLKINGLNESTGGTLTTGASAKYLGVGLYLNSLAVDDYLGQIQIELGTSATDYAEYKTNTQSFVGTFRSVGSVRDKVRYDTDRYVVDRYVGYDFNDVLQAGTTWGKSVTLTNSSRYANTFLGLDIKRALSSVTPANVFLKIGSDLYPAFSENDTITEDERSISIDADSDVLWIRILDADLTTQDSAGVEAYLQANDVTFYYEYDTPLLENEEIDSDGLLVQDDPTTLIVQSNLATEYDLVYSLNNTKQIVTNAKNNANLKRETTLIEDRVEVVENKLTETVLYDSTFAIPDDTAGTTTKTITADISSFKTVRLTIRDSINAELTPIDIPVEEIDNNIPTHYVSFKILRNVEYFMQFGISGTTMTIGDAFRRILTVGSPANIVDTDEGGYDFVKLVGKNY